MQKKQKISLTESVMLAVEAVKQALNILYGEEVRFANMDLDVGKLRQERITHHTTFEERFVSVEAWFHFTNPSPGKNRGEPSTFNRRVSASVELLKKGNGPWTVKSGPIIVDDEAYFVRWEYPDGPLFRQAWIIPEFEPKKQNNEWFVGFDLHDRHKEPLKL